MNIYANYGHKEFYIALGYKGDVIREYFKKIKNEWKVNLIDTGADTYTGGRLKRLEKYLINETFLLTYCDGLSNININEIINKTGQDLVGIRDLHFVNEKVFISMIVKNDKGTTINLYSADLNYENLNFEIFFETNEYWQDYNVFSGGRIDTYDDNNIIFAIGYSNVNNVAQEKESLLGKIIKINLNSKQYELISLGHRNPQGLKFIDKENLIINSEHGPKGGDEININTLSDGKVVKNYGWDISSYGTKYNGTDPYKKSHKDFGFEEPAIYYVPSIGISEILYFEKNSYCSNRCIWASSLRAHSIYLLKMNDEFKKLIANGRIDLKGNRIRDIDYDKDLNMIILLSENVPSLISLKKIHN